MSTVGVIGTGYVGLVTGTCLAHLGHRVVCADVAAGKVAGLQRGEIPIVESQVDELVAEGLVAGRLRFVVGADQAVEDAEFIFLCVPTPQDEDGSADLSYIQAASREIAPHLKPGSVVINKSTVPVGSTRVVERALRRPDVSVVSNPEFLREGSAVHDFLHPDRIVIGNGTREACERVAALYEKIDAPVVITDAASAEMIKYASNAFLATKISFANAISNVCEAVGADVDEVIKGMGFDHRIGFDFLKPGPGWGGSCFPKDTRAMVKIAEEGGYDFSLLRGVVQVNEEQQARVVTKIKRMAGGPLNGAVIAAWGLTFKAGTDDIRESPALAIIRRLLAKGAEVHAYDPGHTKPIDGVTICANPYDAARDTDVTVVLTEWPEFAEVDLAKIRELMRSPRIVDARNLLDPDEARAQGFEYTSLGRR